MGTRHPIDMSFKVLQIALALSALAYTTHAGSGSPSTPSPTPNPNGTPYNPSDKLFTGELGSHVASTLMNTKQFLSNGQLTGELSNYVVQNSTCDPKLGILHTAKGGLSPESPIGIFFTQAGQIAGLRIQVWGSKAAQGRAISEGYWIPAGENTWYLSMSFRPEQEMCTQKQSANPVGDRIIMNQDTIAKSV